MTKDQLRDALAEIGVKTPAKMKKAELVKLYREKVLEQNVSALSPNDSIIGGFSSDEEEPAPLDTTHITDPADVQQLTNDEIFLKLKELGELVAGGHVRHAGLGWVPRFFCGPLESAELRSVPGSLQQGIGETRAFVDGPSMANGKPKGRPPSSRRACRPHTGFDSIDL